MGSDDFAEFARALETAGRRWRDANAREVWSQALRRAELGDHPTAGELGDMVAAWGVPTFAEDYLGRRIRGEVHLGDGGAPAIRYERWSRAALLRQRIVLHAEVLRRQGERAPVQRAKELVAGKDMDADTLDRASRRDLADAPAALRDFLAGYHREVATLDDDRLKAIVDQGVGSGWRLIGELRIYTLWTSRRALRPRPRPDKNL